MAIQQIHIAQFMQYFEGHKTNYGEHRYEYDEKEKKEKGKNKTVTDKLVTIDNYKAHLEGRIGLGLVPINKEGMCKFSVIDVDLYDVGLMQFVRAIDNNNFPLVPFRSKSGGMHIYAFYNKPIEAKFAIEIMKKMTSVLSIDVLVKKKSNRTVEIFPKQSTMTDGRVGNWINLPYYDYDKTKQYAVAKGKPLSLSDALVLMRERASSYENIMAFLDNLKFSDGPPCLQTINILNNLDKHSGRNNYLFSLGVYLKKKDEEFWEQTLSEANANLPESLSEQELESTVLKSLRKRDYTYKCNDAPCVDFCNKTICKNREYGVGKVGGYFSNLEYGKLTQIQTMKPYYEWEVKLNGDEKFKLLRFKDEDEIIKQDAFIRLCFRELHTLPIKLKQVEWFKIVNQHLQEIETRLVDKEDDTSPIVMFHSYLFDYLLTRAMAQNKTQLNMGKVYYNEQTKEYYFKTKHFINHLIGTRNFRIFDGQEIHGYLKDVGAKPIRVRIENGRQIRVYALHRNYIDNDALPEVAAVESFEPDFDEIDEDGKF